MSNEMDNTAYKYICLFNYGILHPDKNIKTINKVNNICYNYCVLLCKVPVRCIYYFVHTGRLTKKQTSPMYNITIQQNNTHLSNLYV